MFLPSPTDDHANILFNSATTPLRRQRQSFQLCEPQQPLMESLPLNAASSRHVIFEMFVVRDTLTPPTIMQLPNNAKRINVNNISHGGHSSDSYKLAYLFNAIHKSQMCLRRF